MANTVTQTTIEGSSSDALISRVIHITSDATEETDLVIFDNSAFAADTSIGRLLSVEANGSPCVCILEWDQTTDSEIIRFNPADGFKFDFLKNGGGGNPNAAGATGDLLLTTTGLDSGDEVTIKILVKQS
jgi:hypothetical protein